MVRTRMERTASCRVHIMLGCQRGLLALPACPLNITRCTSQPKSKRRFVVALPLRCTQWAVSSPQYLLSAKFRTSSPFTGVTARFLLVTLGERISCLVLRLRSLHSPAAYTNQDLRLTAGSPSRFLLASQGVNDHTTRAPPSGTEQGVGAGIGYGIEANYDQSSSLREPGA
jgi:hypothetical protein